MSVTVGPKGYHLTFGKQGVRQTIDFPGEGLSHTSLLFKDNNDKRKGKRNSDDDDDAVGCFPFGCLLFILVVGTIGYFAADYFNLIPQNYLSDLLLQLTQWIRKSGF
jgi:hypothetical protein